MWHPQKDVPMLKRFIVFTGYKDQCQSGSQAIDSDFDTKEEAIAHATDLIASEDEDTLWVEIYDSETSEVVEEMGYEVPS
jgi:hypothetical protein